MVTEMFMAVAGLGNTVDSTVKNAHLHLFLPQISWKSYFFSTNKIINKER